MDYNVWLKYKEDMKTLEHFEENINTDMSPATTSTYRNEIVRAIDNIIVGLRKELILKEEVK